jgi:hypothetical protein
MGAKDHCNVGGTGMAELAPLAGHSLEPLGRTNNGAIPSGGLPGGALIIRRNDENGAETIRHGGVGFRFRMAGRVDGETVSGGGFKGLDRCGGPLVVGIGVTPAALVGFRQRVKRSPAGDGSGPVKVSGLVMTPQLTGRQFADQL